MDTVDLIVELCHLVNEKEFAEEYKYIIKLSQILWVNALIKDEYLSEELIGVIKMKSNFIQNYERNLIESAVESAVKEAVEEAVELAVEETTNIRNKDIASIMKEKNYSREEILEITGVDILKM